MLLVRARKNMARFSLIGAGGGTGGGGGGGGGDGDDAPAGAGVTATGAATACEATPSSGVGSGISDIGGGRIEHFIEPVRDGGSCMLLPPLDAIDRFEAPLLFRWSIDDVSIGPP